MYTHIHVRGHKHYTRCWGGQYYSVEILKEGKCLVGAQGRYVQPLKKKRYMVAFIFMFINRECNQQLPPVTLWKVELLAIAEWLLSSSFCAPTCLP